MAQVKEKSQEPRLIEHNLSYDFSFRQLLRQDNQDKIIIKHFI